MAATRKSTVQAPVVEKNNAVAFVNWQLPATNGKQLRSSKGFPLFQNPKYPNRSEDILVALARKHGGAVTVNMQCRIVLNNSVPAEDFDLDALEIVEFGPAAEPMVDPIQ